MVICSRESLNYALNWKGSLSRYFVLSVVASGQVNALISRIRRTCEVINVSELQPFSLYFPKKLRVHIAIHGVEDGLERNPERTHVLLDKPLPNKR